MPELFRPLVTATPAEGTAYMAEVAILTRHCCGAGIGGGDGGDGGSVTINNSKVTAVSERNSKAVAIGRGKNGEGDGILSLSNNEKVDIGTSKKENNEYRFIASETVQPSVRVSTCQTNNMVQLNLCDHSTQEWVWEGTTQHAKVCSYCGEWFYEHEDHEWNANHVCTKCGATTEPTELTIIEQSNDGEIRKTVTVPQYGRYTLPECENAPDGTAFVHWKVSGGGIYLPCEYIYAWEADTITAVYCPTADVEYINEFGEPQTVKARKISGIWKNAGQVLSLSSGWYVLDCDVETSAVIIKGDVHLILADGKKLSFVYDPDIEGLHGFDRYATLRLYGQSQQSGEIDCNNLCVVELAHFIQFGGKFSAYAFTSSQYIAVTDGVFNVYDNIRCESFNAYGGKVFTNGLFNVEGKYITIGWKNPDDSFHSNHFYDNEDDLWNEDTVHNCILQIEYDQALTDGTTVYKDTLTSEQINNIKGKTLIPYIEHDYAEPEWIWSNEYTETTAVFRCKDCDDVQQVPASRMVNKASDVQILLMDRAYEDNKIRTLAEKHELHIVVSPKKNLKEPWEYDKELYKKRNQIERYFLRSKRFRKVFTRYDKLASIFFPVITLAMIFDALFM